MYLSILTMWNTFYINSDKKFDHYLDHFAILFAYHSCRLGNSEIELHDTKELFKSGMIADFIKRPETFIELRNQKICYEFLKDKIIRKEPITLKLIKDIHAILLAGIYDEKLYMSQNELPGYFRVHDCAVQDGKRGSNPSKVESELSVLLDEINRRRVLNEVLINASYLHAQFEKIQPFADGNGRVGRTLLNYFLMINDHPPLIIYHTDRYLYEDYLDAYCQNENLIPLYELLKCEVERTWNKFYINFTKEQ